MPQHYPFTAVVGSDDMTLALLLTTVSPEIGGVLVRGEKGTAKSTAVRALAAVLPPIDVVAGDRFSTDPADTAPLSPDGPFGADVGVETRPVRLVELPVGATEDRLLGSLHLERALSAGVAEYEPGLLARAHRGILYVDEVNLLHDHLVDLLLDAAAMGRATVERDGVSVVHAARFVLVGTMNPEEGELRPQLLDRFGLTVEVAAPRDPSLRTEVVRRRLAFDAAPEAFAERYADDEAALRARIATAQELVASVVLGDGALRKIAEVCAAFDVDGLRADIVTARTAIAHAAWHGRRYVLRQDIRAAALLALPHRRRRNPFDAPGIDEDLLDQVLGDDEPDPDPQPEEPRPDDQPGEPGGGTDGGGTDGGGPDGAGDGPEPGGDGGSAAEPPAGRDDQGGPDAGPDSPDSPDTPADQPGDGAGTPAAPAGTTVAAGAPYRPRVLRVAGTGEGEAGRRSRAITSTGRRIGNAPGTAGGLDLVGTVRAAAPHQHARGRTAGRLLLRGADLRGAVREGRESNLVLFCVDASGSMAARKRMQQVKTAILSLLLDAYQRRDKVGLVTFRGLEAEVALPPTGSIDVAARRLDALPAGGRTPLAEGLIAAADVLRRERLRDPRRRPLLVLVTDGRATAGADPVERSRQVAAWLAEQGVETVVVDCENGPFRLGLARKLAEHLQATYLPVAEVSAEVLAGAARAATADRAERPHLDRSGTRGVA
ncbi:magnesium chelatase subunit D family protein [Nocardioides sp. ChNu-153]|uniref:magnesium chelatase subunit D family protein n=1 Tax=Nocardioides sp. ChNu-153 TaxID=2779364 RepID=UPI00264C0586|nr:magnesium chelatase subunit D family protein [Nocardioides sp. ChNu-153]MDN7120380.1 magnesium chelatase subunit D family protein [Nocardioides sp. ChNu-153]